MANEPLVKTEQTAAKPVDLKAEEEFHELEVDVALDYEKHEVGSALPWDHVRGVSKAAWSKVSGLISPREPSRGIRGSI